MIHRTSITNGRDAYEKSRDLNSSISRIANSYQYNVSYVEYMMRVTRELLTFLFHTKLCFVELQNKPKISVRIES